MTTRILLVLSILIISTGAALAQDRKAEPFNFAYASVTGNRAPLWVGRDNGVFEKYGLDLKMVQIGAGSVIVSALLAGEVHLTAEAAATGIAAAAQGAPTVIVGTNGGAPYLLVANAAIKSVADLKGKIVGSSRAGSGTDFMLRRMLANSGFTVGKDISLIATGVSESQKRAAMIQQGKIDATLITADIAHQLIEVRGEKFTVLGNSRDFGVPRAAADMITTRPTLKSYRGRFKNFFMAYAESVMVGRKNKELVLRAFRRYMRLDDPKVLEGTYRIQFLETISPRPFPNEEAIQIQVEDLAASTAPKLKGAKAAEFIDVSLLRELESEGFFARIEKQ